MIARRLIAFAGLAALIVAAPAGATHFRYGLLTWQLASGNTVDFTLQNVFRRDNSPSFNPCVNPTTNTVIACSGGDGFPLPGDVIREDIGDTRLNFGDGSPTIGSPGGGGLFYLVTSVDPTNNWAFGLAIDNGSLPAIDTSIRHTYGVPGVYIARIEDCCRISPVEGSNAHINNPDLDYRVETRVEVGMGNSSAVSALPPIVICPQNAVCTFLVPATDPDGDTLTFRLSTAPEADTGAFVQPGPPQAANAASIDPMSGVYTWNTNGATLGPVALNTLYSTQVTIEERDALNNIKGKVAVDFFIQLVPDVNEPPVFDHPPTPTCSSTLTAQSGVPFSFTVQASDPDAGDIVTLNAAGIPAGASMTPPLPTTGNPVSSLLSWTPLLSDAGTYVISFTATDTNNQQAICPVTIVVEEHCGDGNLDPGEQCDDGNNQPGDCCSPVCTIEPPGSSCQGNNACDQTFTCDATGHCVGSNEITCLPLDQCHDAGVCDQQTGLCSNPNKPDGTVCDDGDPCRTNDQCMGGVCVATSASDVDGDGIPDICDSEDGELKVTRLKLKGDTSTTKDTGRFVAKGHFVTLTTADAFTHDNPITARVQDRLEGDALYTWAVTDCAFTPSTARLKCRSADKLFSGYFRPVPATPNAVRYTLKFKDLPVLAPFKSPITVTLTYGAGIDRVGHIEDCKAGNTSITCKEF